MLSKDQLESIRSMAWSLGELLELGGCRKGEYSVSDSSNLNYTINELSRKDDLLMSSSSNQVSPVSPALSLSQSPLSSTLHHSSQSKGRPHTSSPAEDRFRSRPSTPRPIID